MKSRLYTNLLFTLAVGILAAACSGASQDKPTQLKALKEQHAKIATEITALEKQIAKENPNSVQLKSKEVVVSQLAAQPFDYYLQTQGAVEATDNILVSSKTVGVITNVYAKEGDVVSKGQTLALIDNSVTVRSIEEVKSNLQLATTVYERQKNLWDQKIGTEVQYLQAKNNKESLENRLATLNEQLDMSRIKSPISGSVDEVDVKIGQNAAPGAPAFRVVSSDKLKMKASVSEAYVTSIHKGDKVSIVLSDINKSIDARITFVGKTINQLSRTFPIEVALSSNNDLRPNMTGVLKIIFHSEAAALIVPINIVQDVNGQKIVYTAVKEGDKMVARRNVIEVAGVFGSAAHIKGLKAGDKIITTGYQGLNDGELIKI